MGATGLVAPPILTALCGIPPLLVMRKWGAAWPIKTLGGQARLQLLPDPLSASPLCPSVIHPPLPVTGSLCHTLCLCFRDTDIFPIRGYGKLELLGTAVYELTGLLRRQSPPHSSGFRGAGGREW